MLMRSHAYVFLVLCLFPSVLVHVFSEAAHLKLEEICSHHDLQVFPKTWFLESSFRAHAQVKSRT
jgi:hypothetical protein